MLNRDNFFETMNQRCCLRAQSSMGIIAISWQFHPIGRSLEVLRREFKMITAKTVDDLEEKIARSPCCIILPSMITATRYPFYNRIEDTRGSSEKRATRKTYTHEKISMLLARII